MELNINMNKEIEIIKVKSGRFAGESFKVEGLVDDILPYLATKGNMAAKNALDIDEYTIKVLESKPKTDYVMPKV